MAFVHISCEDLWSHVRLCSHKALRRERCSNCQQGGRTWQPFVGGRNGHENFRQARIYNFRDKCDVFARNRKFAKLTQ